MASVSTLAAFGLVDQSQEDRERNVMVPVKRIADGINPSLTVSTDVCANYTDRRLPVLDIKTWIDRDHIKSNQIKGIFSDK